MTINSPTISQANLANRSAKLINKRDVTRRGRMGAPAPLFGCKNKNPILQNGPKFFSKYPGPFLIVVDLFFKNPTHFLPFSKFHGLFLNCGPRLKHRDL